MGTTAPKNNPNDPAPGSGSPGQGGGSAQSSRIHRLLTLNSISNFSRYAIALVITFFLTPFIIKNLGDAVYGLWVVLLSFVGYASILELGIQPAVVKLVGQQKALNHTEKLEELITVAFFFLGGAGLLNAILFFTIVPRLADRLGGADIIALTEAVVAVVAINIWVLFFNYLFAGILYGWQLYPLKNLIDILGWILNAVLLVVFLTQGNLLILAGCKLAADLLVLLATIIACHRILPGGLTIKIRQLTRGSFRELIGFGGRIFISATTTRMAVHAQPIIIAAALSSTAAAFFAIPSRLVDYSRQITWALATGFMPMFSELDSKNERGLLRTIYLTYSRYIFLATVPALILVLVFGKRFIELWIGPEYADRGAVVLYLLALAALVESFQPLIWRMFIGVGRLNVLVRVSAIASISTVVLSIILVRRFGLGGVAASVILGTVVSQLIFVREVCRYLEVGLGDLLREVHLRPIPVSGLAYLGCLGFSRLIGQGSFAEMGLGAGLLAGIYLPMVYLGALSGNERGWVRNRLSRWFARVKE